MVTYSKMKPFVDGMQELAEIAPDVSEGFRSFRRVINEGGPLDPLQRELCLLAGFAVANNERGFRIHCNMAAKHGLTLEQVQHAVLLMIGSNIGLMPALDIMAWAKEEFDGMAEQAQG